MVKFNLNLGKFIELYFFKAEKSNLTAWHKYSQNFQTQITRWTRIILTIFFCEGVCYTFIIGLLCIVLKLVGYDIDLSYGMHLE